MVSSDFESAAGVGVVVFYVVYMLVMLGLAAASYVLNALGLQTIAKRRGIRRPWLAWIPVAGTYLLGCISDQYQYAVKGKNRSRRKVLLGLDIAVVALVVLVYALMIVMVMTLESDTAAMGFAIGFLGIMFVILGLAVTLMVFYYMALFDLYSSCNPDTSVLFLVLSIVINQTEPFFVFFNRKKDRGMPPRQPAIPENVEPQ